MRRKGQHRRERGASIVELALIAPVLVLLVFGVIDLARGYQLQVRAENAAREGAAYAQVRPNDKDCTTVVDIRDRVLGEEDGLASRAGFRVDVFGQDDLDDWVPIEGCNGTVAQAGERVRVDVTLTHHILTPVVSQVVGDAIDLTGSAEVRVQRR